MQIGTIFLARILYEDLEDEKEIIHPKYEEYRLVKAKSMNEARDKVWKFYKQVKTFRPISVVIMEDVL